MTQYERLTKAGLERINKFNKCVETIEKTFLAGIFDHITEHIDNAVSQIVNFQDS